jgi:hypothetical protein
MPLAFEGVERCRSPILWSLGSSPYLPIYGETMIHNQFCKNFLLLFSIFFFLIWSDLSAEQINSSRQEMWDKMSYEVNHWVDGIGHPIDKEIKETVIALNLLGIKTTASCEGHADHGTLYPWVDINNITPEIEKIIQEFSDIQEQFLNEEIRLKTKYPSLSFKDLYEITEAKKLKKLNNKRHSIIESLTRARVNCLEPLNQLLSEFYQNRKSIYDNILIVSRDSLCRLHSVGADKQTIRSQKEQSLYLKEYKEEMRAFTIFLKQKFMNS